MKNQYFGDVNDYRKYGLLRALLDGGELHLLVAWLLTADDGGRDGGKRAYLSQPKRWRPYDPDLYVGMVEMVGDGSAPRVSLIEESGLLPRTEFFSSTVPDDREQRAEWRDELRRAAMGTDLVFFDPDNGIEIKSRPIGTRDSSKYLAWDEIDLVWGLSCSVLIYQHFPRVKREVFINSMCSELRERTGAAVVQALATSHVLFLLAAQPGHEAELQRGVELVAKRWRDQIEVVSIADGAALPAIERDARVRTVRNGGMGCHRSFGKESRGGRGL